MLQKILDNQNPFWQFMSKLFDVAVLNILWLLISLPVFTIGGATTAVYTVCFQLVQDKAAGTLIPFWKSFKLNFKQATLIWLILLAVIAVLVFDLWYFLLAQTYLTGMWKAIICGLLSLVLIVAFLTAIYAFALLALFDNTVKGTLVNALILALRHPFRSLGSLLIDLALMILTVYSLFRLPMLSFVMILFSAALAIFLNSVVLFPVFRKSLPADDVPEEDGAL